MLTVFFWETPKIRYPTFEEFIIFKKIPTIKKDLKKY